MPNQFFPVPQGSFYEVKYLNALEQNNPTDALHLLKNYRQSINVHTWIDEESLVDHTINAFLKNASNEENDPVHYMNLIKLMISYGLNLNMYDNEDQTTLFTRLCGCNITTAFLSFIFNLAPPVWINPETELTDAIFSMTPLGQIATQFDASLVETMCRAGANPNSDVFNPKSAYKSLVYHVITVALDEDYFEDAESTETITEVLNVLLSYEARVDSNSITLLESEFERYPDNHELETLIELLKERHQPQAEVTAPGL
ncbi:MAG: hypothetical protein P1U39_00845 [Legionellaceae bacterium]|nr:hypothetical protein [Legionellaceae bacterium]